MFSDRLVKFYDHLKLASYTLTGLMVKRDCRECIENYLKTYCKTPALSKQIRRSCVRLFEDEDNNPTIQINPWQLFLPALTNRKKPTESP